MQAAAAKIFRAFSGAGYARLDFRMDGTNKLFFLEINFTCSVFYGNGYEGSADYILQIDGIGQQGFLKKIIEEGILRHQRRLKKYLVKGNAIAGFGIYAAAEIHHGEIIFTGEERSQRIATKSHIMRNWDAAGRQDFKRYAYPVSEQVFLLWDQNPVEWAPQNHSCNPNTAYRGLDVYALRDIGRDEELTLDYGDFLDEHMEPFHCSCGSINCRNYITGKANNSITAREEPTKAW